MGIRLFTKPYGIDYGNRTTIISLEAYIVLYNRIKYHCPIVRGILGKKVMYTRQ